jgi:AcrR family transcriptional regulator
LGAERRTQAERRAATRTKLLDAALGCLIDAGYASLTTRNVAERAGVSQGTQMHHFPTRAQFVADTVRHVAYRLTDEVQTAARASRARSERRRLEELLDHVWRLHRTPVFQATTELWVAARTEPELRIAMKGVITDVNRLIADSASDLFPELMARPHAGEVLDLTLATLRGLSLLQSVDDDADVDRRWRRTRGHLLGLYDTL